MTNIDVLIPARNEEQALPLVVAALPAKFIRQIYVVDNGSTDKTAQIAHDLGCRVVSCPVAGYGRACLAGLAEMASNPPDIVVFLDGDFSDNPQELTRLIGPIVSGSADLVLGSRVMGQAAKGSLTFVQRFGNALATQMMAWLWGHRYTDLGPFRAISWRALQLLDMEDVNYGWTIEMQIKALQQKLAIIEMGVSYRQRIGKSKISGTISGSVKAGTKIIWTILKYRWRR